MGNSFKTFLKHTAKDFHNQSVNPPVVRASTIIFKSMQDIKKTQNKYLKDPVSGNFDYGRQGTSTTYALQQILRKIEECYKVYLTPTGFGAIFLGVLSVVKPDDEILVTDSVYSPSRLLTETYLKKFNIRAIFYNPNDINDLKSKITKKQVLYLITGFVGIYFVSFGFSNAFSEFNLGALLALLAAISYGIAINIVQPLINEHGSLKTLKMALRYATIISLVLLAINSGPSVPTYNISLFPLLMLGVGSSGIAFLSFYNLIDDVGAVAGSITVYIIPIFSTIFGFTFLNETTEAIQLVGIFIVIFSAFQFSRIKN